MNLMKSEEASRWEDRRGEVRRKAAGSVSLRLADDYPIAFDARLLDISASGFRVLHFNDQLRSGHVCEFRLPGTKGQAQVVWNRTTPEHIETGFLILSCEPI